MNRPSLFHYQRLKKTLAPNHLKNFHGNQALTFHLVSSTHINTFRKTLPHSESFYSSASLKAKVNRLGGLQMTNNYENQDKSYWNDFDDSWEGDSDIEITSSKPAILHQSKNYPVHTTDSSPIKAHNVEILAGINFDESFSSDEDTEILNFRTVDPMSGPQRQEILAELFRDSSEDDEDGIGGDIKRLKSETVHLEVKESNSQESDSFDDDDDADFLEILKRPSNLTNTLNPTMKTTHTTIKDDTQKQSSKSLLLEMPQNTSKFSKEFSDLSNQPEKVIRSIDLTLYSENEDASHSPSPKRSLYPNFIQPLPQISYTRMIHTDSSISINAPESSSPAHHRTTTTGPRVKIDKSQIYPDLSNYTLNLSTPPEDIFVGLPRTSTNIEESLSMNDVNECVINNEIDISNPPEGFLQRTYKDPLKGKPTKEQIEDSIQQKFRSPEMLLLTQKPSISTALQNKSKTQTSVKEKTDNKKMKLEPLMSKDAKVVTPIILSAEQRHVIDLILTGKSVFYTGSAGTGKSILLRALISSLRQKYGSDGAVGVCASTGLAACNISGTTLHSFTGIGLGTEKVEDLIKKIKRSKKHRPRWKALKVLIIDEISMIDGTLFNKLDEIGRKVRGNDLPWGGVQIVCCGDFFQLPPVSKDDEPPSLFCFESESWKRTIQHTIVLKTVFRQKGDIEFIEMLNEMRLGKVSDESTRKFRALERPLPDSDVEPAELFSTRFEVEKANNLRLSRLNSKEMVYTAHDGGIMEEGPTRDRLLANMIAPKKLVLKKGAQVMMLKNLDENLVNGSLGKVIDFMDSNTYLTYQNLQNDPNKDNEFIKDEISKNLQLAKIKGSLIELNNQPVEKEEEEEEENNTILEETVFDFLMDTKSNDPVVQQELNKKKVLMKQLNDSSCGNRYPLVKFLTPDGQSRCVLVTTETWSVDDEKQQPLVSRVQIPLMLAWSISIHKSQGQTLPRVTVNLKRVFEKGQVYVALSRAVSREGLQVLNFDPSKVLAHDKVINFYKEMSSIDQIHDNEITEIEKKANTSDPGIFNAGLTREGIYRDNSKRMKSRYHPNSSDMKSLSADYPIRTGNPYEVMKASDRPSTNTKYAPAYKFEGNKKQITNLQRRSNVKKPQFVSPNKQDKNDKTKPAKNIQPPNKQVYRKTTPGEYGNSVKKFSEIVDLDAEEVNGIFEEEEQEEDSQQVSEGSTLGSITDDTRNLDFDEKSLSFVDHDSEYTHGDGDSSYRE